MLSSSPQNISYNIIHIYYMVNMSKTNLVDQAHLEIFVTKYKPKKGSASLNQIQAKKLDSSIMSPCSKVLH